MSISKYHVSKNLFDINSFYDNASKTRCTASYSNGSITITATGSDPYIGSICNNGSTLSVSQRPSCSSVKPNTTYTLSLSSAPKCYISLLGSDYVGTELFKSIPSSDTQTSYTFTTGESTYYILLRLGKEIQTGESYSFGNIMLNEGSVAIPYESYYTPYFENIGYKKYETATDAVTSLPQTIIGDGQPISSYTIKGNMTQSGTPTPSNPVYPVETGDKTANLFNVNTTWNPPTGQTATVTVSGNAVTITGKYYAYVTIPVTANGTYTAKYSGTGDRVYVVAYRDTPFNTTNMIAGLSTSGTTINVGNTDTLYILFYSGDGTQGTTTYSDIMLVEGSTAPSSYIPFGYKIPISLNNVTYPIYISEPLRKSLDGSNLYDTIESNGTLTRRVDANGDALATPTTEQVTVPTLTTTGTAEQFNVLTTLAPSEVSLTYHGWHEHEDTKYTSG